VPPTRVGGDQDALRPALGGLWDLPGVAGLDRWSSTTAGVGERDVGGDQHVVRSDPGDLRASARRSADHALLNNANDV
jgi:hypothetical protein